jgi:predicted TIM-barrel fold metal-dependent hydrolase
MIVNSTPAPRGHTNAADTNGLGEGSAGAAPLRTITLEEHFLSRAFVDAGGYPTTFGPPEDTLFDLDDGRIADMDAAGIDVQVLSIASPGTEHLPPAQARPLSRDVNDHLAAAIARHPDRFAGFAALPTADPAAAADELSRTVTEYRFVGAVINGHVNGRYLDDEYFWPILERAEQLGVPIYLHPTVPPQPTVEASYTGNFSPPMAFALSTGAWGWHIETATHVLRMIFAGVFDRYPRLQIVIGHMGEGLSFFVPRLDWVFGHARMSVTTGLQRPISGYLQENVSYTFSGFNWIPNFLNLVAQVGVERIMFSADYPFVSATEARRFLDELPVSHADKRRIAHGNAETLLGL